MSPILAPEYLAALALFCVVAFLWRFFKLRDRNYFYIGRAFGYLILFCYYVWLMFDLNSTDRVFWGRWSQFVFLSTNVVYLLQEMVMVWKNKRVNR